MPISVKLALTIFGIRTLIYGVQFIGLVGTDIDQMFIGRFAVELFIDVLLIIGLFARQKWALYGYTALFAWQALVNWPSFLSKMTPEIVAANFSTYAQSFALFVFTVISVALLWSWESGTWYRVRSKKPCQKPPFVKSGGQVCE
jgi:hypothetical protein